MRAEARLAQARGRRHLLGLLARERRWRTLD
jgi:hypothetical protein